MKNNCMNIQEKLSSGVCLSPEEEKHLRTCPECALFQKITALPREEKEVPARLDKAVLDYARMNCRKTPRFRLWNMILPAAAAFVLCAGALFYAIPSHETACSVKANTLRKSAAEAALDAWSSEADEKLFAAGCEIGNGLAGINSSLDFI